jgi:hypothetical protein
LRLSRDSPASSRAVSATPSPSSLSALEAPVPTPWEHRDSYQPARGEALAVQLRIPAIVNARIALS